jgi:hypothetical protein
MEQFFLITAYDHEDFANLMLIEGGELEDVKKEVERITEEHGIVSRGEDVRIHGRYEYYEITVFENGRVVGIYDYFRYTDKHDYVWKEHEPEHCSHKQWGQWWYGGKESKP